MEFLWAVIETRTKSWRGHKQAADARVNQSRKAENGAIGSSIIDFIPEKRSLVP